MRKTILKFLALCIVSACSSFKSGLTIPAKQTFVLGEYNNKNYTATLVNTSDLPVLVKAINKNSRAITLRIELPPEGIKKVYIDKDEIVYFKNKNGQSVTINVTLNRGVEGMRYVDIQSL